VILTTFLSILLQINIKLPGDMMETELMRIGVSLPDNLLDKFDKIIEKRGYSSRSEGIRDAIRNYISHYEWMGEIKGQRVGTIAVVYDHTKRGLSNALADIQHQYSQLINPLCIFTSITMTALKLSFWMETAKKLKSLQKLYWPSKE